MVFSGWSDSNFVGASVRDQVKFLLIWVGGGLKKGPQVHIHV